MPKIELTQGQTATVSDEDYERVTQHRWFAKLDKPSGRYYVYTNVVSNTTVSGRTTQSLHGFIVGAEPNEMVDHRNGDTLDNTRENLRLATKRQNGANRRLNANNSSGFKGVHFNKTKGKYQAAIKVDGKYINLGLYADPIDAANAYDEAAIRFHGEFALTNAELVSA